MGQNDTALGVLGFGTMGIGIAVAGARAGLRVVCVDSSDSLVDAGMTRASAIIVKAETLGKLGSATAEEVLANLTGSTEISSFSDCGVVVEAIVEDLDSKLQALSAVSSVVSPDAIVATNTSALSVARLATVVTNPGRFAGLHFFNPADRMPLVEVVEAMRTTPATTDALVAFGESIGKQPVVVKDRPGFLLNRLLIPYLNQVVQAFDEGIATKEDIDLAVELGLGYPMGPLKLLDMIGLDTHRHASEAAYEDTKDHHFAAPPLLSRMVDSGLIGNKAGGGFYKKTGV
jgi:3-hydroxybutyryl-CoA dehydrogenase